MRLLLIEDNIELAEMTSAGLAAAGFTIDTVGSLASANHAIAANRYAAIVLDLGLPDGDGESVLRVIRTREDPTPVLVLTARSGVHDRVSALNRGADDYLVKPFAIEELVARVHAVLRRPSQFLGRPLTAGNVAFDVIGRQLYVAESPQTLSARETALLEVLLRRIGRVVPKQIAEDHLGLGDEISSNAIEVYVHRLRKQLQDMGATLEIHTVRGVGYLMKEIKA